MHYVLYEYPKYFVVALLGMNGTGVLIATEWVAVEYLHRPGFDSPALRTGEKSLAHPKPVMFTLSQAKVWLEQ